MSDAASSPAAPGRSLRIGTVLLGGLALTLVFMVLRFPYERLGDRIAEAVERSSGAQVQLGELSLGIVSWGPGLRADGVRVRMPSGTRVDLDQAGVRPALALSWFRGDPALATELEGAQGRARGVLTLGERGGFRGRLEAIDLAELPAELLKGPLSLAGVADVDVDVHGGEQGSEGSVVFRAREGLIEHPTLPIPMPFETLDGEIDLGGGPLATIHRIELASPLASGRASGTVGQATSFDRAPLDLDIELTVSDAVRGPLNAQGVKVGRDGKMRLSVMGTPGEPIVR